MCLCLVCVLLFLFGFVCMVNVSYLFSDVCLFFCVLLLFVVFWFCFGVWRVWLCVCISYVSCVVLLYGVCSLFFVRCFVCLFFCVCLFWSFGVFGCCFSLCGCFLCVCVFGLCVVVFVWLCVSLSYVYVVFRFVFFVW